MASHACRVCWQLIERLQFAFAVVRSPPHKTLQSRDKRQLGNHFCVALFWWLATWLLPPLTQFVSPVKSETCSSLSTETRRVSIRLLMVMMHRRTWFWAGIDLRKDILVAQHIKHGFEFYSNCCMTTQCKLQCNLGYSECQLYPAIRFVN